MSLKQKVKRQSRQRFTRIPSRTRDDGTGKDPWRQYVLKNHGVKEGLKTIQLDALLKGDVRDVGPISHLNAGMTGTDIALLKGLASQIEKCRYFEIGKRRSETLANLSNVAEECYALNRPAGETRKKGIRHKYMFMMGSYTLAPDNVVVLEGDSKTFSFAEIDRKFDLIFINSGSSYQRILGDTRKAFEYLAHDQSIFVWHDYSYFPEQIRYEVLAAILDATDPVHREQLFFVSKTKCAILLRSKTQELG
jgi:hypothetical protein